VGNSSPASAPRFARDGSPFRAPYRNWLLSRPFARGSDRSIITRGWSTRSPPLAVHYLARYTHRVAISNHRLVAIADDTVSFRWKDYRHGSQIRTLTLNVDQFLRRFLLHVLPKRFVRIRYFGLLASRCRTDDLATCRTVLAVPPPPVAAQSVALPRSWPCPRCGAPMRIVERLTARQLFVEARLADIVYDSS
jgi:hypothetical protein